jgi:hypothetical protein
MTSKTLEIRDEGTTLPILVIRLDPKDEKEKRNLSHAGFGNTAEKQSGYFILCKLLNTHQATHDPYDWNSRTMREAHLYISQNFDQLESGSVVDVQYILGETKKSKHPDLS